MRLALDLFGGAGGSHLGLEAAGLSVVSVERHPPAHAVAVAAGLDCRLADVADFDLGERPWLMWASPPCQPHSSAGKRQAAADERDGWQATLASIDRHQPTWLIVENVRGLVSHRRAVCPDPVRCSGCVFLGMLNDLQARFAEVHWAPLNAADYGVPQHRRRTIIVAGPREIRWPMATHYEYSEPRWVSIGEVLGLTSEHAPKGARSKEGNRPLGDEPAPTVRASDGTHTTVRVIGAGTNPHGPGREHERRRRDITDEPAPTVTAVQVGNRGPWLRQETATAGVRLRGMDEAAPTVGTLYLHDETSQAARALARPSLTVTATEGKGYTGRSNRASDSLYDATGRRRLTVEEAATLQDFPAGYPWRVAGTKKEQYRAVGNAMPPRFAQVIAEAVMRTHEAVDVEWPEWSGDAEQEALW